MRTVRARTSSESSAISTRSAAGGDSPADPPWVWSSWVSALVTTQRYWVGGLRTCVRLRGERKPSEVVRGERVTGVDRVLLHAGLEPLHPLCRRTVGPSLRVDPAAALLLDAVVADRGRRRDGLPDVGVGQLREERLPGLVVGGAGRPGPPAGEAVRL